MRLYEFFGNRLQNNAAVRNYWVQTCYEGTEIVDEA